MWILTWAILPNKILRHLQLYTNEFQQWRDANPEKQDLNHNAAGNFLVWQNIAFRLIVGWGGGGNFAGVADVANALLQGALADY